jgi:hypothetical protein
MTNFWNKLFDWLERVLPSALASFAFGYRLGKKEQAKIDVLLQKAQYELAKKNNELEGQDEKTSKETVTDFLNDTDSK